MNLLLMGLMMGLMLVFFHGRGHHKPGPSPEHHTMKPDEAKVPSSKARGTEGSLGELPSESNPDPKISDRAETTPPALTAE